MLGGSDLCCAYSAEFIIGLISSSRIEWVRFNEENDGAGGGGRRRDDFLFRTGIAGIWFIF